MSIELATCPACQQPVSFSAVLCPHCGYDPKPIRWKKCRTCGTWLSYDAHKVADHEVTSTYFLKPCISCGERIPFVGFSARISTLLAVGGASCVTAIQWSASAGDDLPSRQSGAAMTFFISLIVAMLIVGFLGHLRMQDGTLLSRTKPK